MSRTEYVDLLQVEAEERHERCDICVVGAGAAGSYLAAELASRGVDVILVEAGGATCTSAADTGFDAHFAAELYPGATQGRFFGLGGSTSAWGGLLIPHTDHDIKPTSREHFDPWQQIVQTAAAKTDAVLQRLGRREGGDFAAFAQRSLGSVGAMLQDAGLDVTTGLFLPFRTKNLAFLLKGTWPRRARLRVFTHAVASEWKVEATASEARLQQVVAVSEKGNKLHIAAQRFVIAAGAIESARALLELNESHSQPVLRPGAPAGCFLADHLSLPIADVAPASLEQAARLFGPRFSGAWMRSFRFLESQPPDDAPRAFAHFIFDNQNPGFALAKEVLTAMQGRRLPKLSASGVLAGIDGVLRLGYEKLVHSKLYTPPDTPIHLQLDIEQVALRDHRITLADERDRYGRRVANIQWEIDAQDMENIEQTAQRILACWPTESASLPRLIPRILDRNTSKPHDAYHPVGTCRMGEDQDAVVDKQLKVWGVANLWSVSTGVLPSAGTANPTFTMLCLAHQLAEDLEALS